MPAPLEHFLTQEEVLYLRQMAERSQGWTYLLKLLNLLEQEARQQLQGFKNSDDAYEKRGYTNGVSMVANIVRSLYMERTDDSAPSNTAEGTTEGASTTADAP